MSTGVVLRAQLLSEDQSAGAAEVLRNLLLHMFRSFDPVIGDARIALTRPERDEVRQGALPSHWNSKGRRQRRTWVEMTKAITTALVHRQQPQFVFFHFDGETTWTARADSDREERFQEHVARRVREAARAALSRQGRPGDLERVLTRLIPLVSYYCVEAWCYQHTVRARECCERRSCSQQAAHRALFNAWAQDRATLDEVEKLPETVSCLKKRFNRELTGDGFPLAEVLAADASLAASYRRVAEHPELRELVLETRPGWRKEAARYAAEDEA